MATLDARNLKWELRSRAAKRRLIQTENCCGFDDADVGQPSETTPPISRRLRKRRVKQFYVEDHSHNCDSDNGDIYTATTFSGQRRNKKTEPDLNEDSDSDVEIHNVCCSPLSKHRQRKEVYIIEPDIDEDSDTDVESENSRFRPVPQQPPHHCFIIPETPSSPLTRRKKRKKRKRIDESRSDQAATDNCNDLISRSGSLSSLSGGIEHESSPQTASGLQTETATGKGAHANSQAAGSRYKHTDPNSSEALTSRQKTELASKGLLLKIPSTTLTATKKLVMSYMNRRNVLASPSHDANQSRPTSSRASAPFESSPVSQGADRPEDFDSSSTDFSVSPVFGRTVSNRPTSSQEPALQGTVSPSDRSKQEARPSGQTRKKKLGFATSAKRKLGPPPRFLGLNRRAISERSSSSLEPEIQAERPSVAEANSHTSISREESSQDESSFPAVDDVSPVAVDTDRGFDESDGPGEPSSSRGRRDNTRKKSSYRAESSTPSARENDFLPASVLIDSPQMASGSSAVHPSGHVRNSENSRNFDWIRNNGRQVSSTPLSHRASGPSETTPTGSSLIVTPGSEVASLSRGSGDSDNDSLFRTPQILDCNTPTISSSDITYASLSSGNNSASVSSSPSNHPQTRLELSILSLPMSPPARPLTDSPSVIDISDDFPSPQVQRHTRSRYSRSPFISAAASAAAAPMDSSLVSPGTMQSIARLEQIEADEAFARQLQEEFNQQTAAFSNTTSAPGNDGVPLSPATVAATMPSVLEDNRPPGASPVRRSARPVEVFPRTEDRRMRLQNLISQSEEILSQMNARIGTLHNTIQSTLPPVQRRRRIAGIASPSSPSRRRNRRLSTDQFRRQLEELDRQLQHFAEARQRRQGSNRQDTRRPLFDRSFSGASYEQLLELHDLMGPANRGLSKTQLDQLPKFEYVAEGDREDNTCNICFVDYERKDCLRRLPCFHRYHAECIDPWLKQNPTCPVCRVRIEMEMEFPL